MSSLVMARSVMVTVACLMARGQALLTCPGFPGYCSESFPGQTCNVVCDFGRNNVPLCQEDGTWTDIPRCIEHDPGVDEQIPGTCPSIPGYCAQGFLNTRCRFDCTTGPDIDSLCSIDGTWQPYPTCQGDLRETRDGCDGCPGPKGGARNRTAEAIQNRNTASDRRVPKIISNNGERKSVPSFAGNINIGRLEPQTGSDRFNQARPTTTTTPAPTFNNFQQNQFTRQQQRPQQQQPQQFQTQFQQNQFRQQQQRPQQQFQQQQPQSQFSRNQQQFQQQQPQRQFQPQFQQQPQQQPQPTPAPRQQQPQQQFNPAGPKTQSLFDQIKERINREKAAKAAILRKQNTNDQPAPQQPQPRPQPTQPRPQPTQPTFRQPQPTQPTFRQPQSTFRQQNFGTFGVFEAVDLSSGPNPTSAFSPAPAVPRNLGSRQAQNEGSFFGAFEEVNLQG